VTVRFTLVNLVAAPPETVFDLSLDIDLHLRSMAAWRERVVGSPASPLDLGDEVRWTARHFGLPFSMTSRIAEHDRPRRFVDEQVRGPFAAFRHVHTFEAAEAGTRMTDEVAFAAPLGPLGKVAESLVLRRRLRHLIEVRNELLVREAADRTA
jgi:ligand-binding SRPBCC domain-containing protein